jgi:hypothetical protein
MDAATHWWLHNTSTGRRTLERIMPLGAIPSPVRRQICVERGHDPMPDGTCRRCGGKGDGDAF